MSEEKLGQEPAFPSKGNATCRSLSGYASYQNLKFEGMSKRFYAACAAMQGILANPSIKLTLGPDKPNENDRLIKVAYSLADELLKQE